MIIQNLDLTSLSCSRGIYTPGQYLPYLSEPDIYQTLSAINPSIWKAKYIPLYGFNADDMRFTAVQATLGLLGIPLSNNQPLGFLPMNRRWGPDFERFRAMNPEGTDCSNDPRALAVLNELGNVCKANGIRIVFSFIRPEYYENYSMILNRESIMSEFRALAARYQAPFFDYSDTPITHEKEYFYNSGQLKCSGRKVVLSYRCGGKTKAEYLRWVGCQMTSAARLRVEMFPFVFSQSRDYTPCKVLEPSTVHQHYLTNRAPDTFALKICSSPPKNSATCYEPGRRIDPLKLLGKGRGFALGRLYYPDRGESDTQG